jgi:hypothetical protein
MGGAAFMGALIGTPAFGSDIGSGRQKVWEWAHVSVNYYDRAIPDGILNTALEIKEAIPSCDLRVYYLQQTEHFKVRPHPDPFLEVRLGNEKYFVEQWDERDLPRLTT